MTLTAPVARPLLNQCDRCNRHTPAKLLQRDRLGQWICGLCRCGGSEVRG